MRLVILNSTKKLLRSLRFPIGKDNRDLIYRFRVILVSYFLAFFLITGIILTIVIPPFQIPDEDAHWWSEITRLDHTVKMENEINYWNTLPLYFEVRDPDVRQSRWANPSLFLNISSMKKTRRAHVDIDYGTIFTYPGFLMAYFLTQPMKSTPVTALVGFYLTRLTGGLLILFVLVRTSSLLSKKHVIQRPGTLPILALCFSPLFVQQSFAVHSDVVCNFFFLWLILIWNKWRELNCFDLFVLLLLGVVACSTKPMFAISAVTIFLFSLIYYQDKPSFKNETRVKALKGYAAATVIILSTFLFVLASIWGLHHGLVGENIQVLPPGVNAPKQLLWILNNPGEAFHFLNRNLFVLMKFPGWAVSPLGWLDAPLSSSTIYIWLLIFSLALVIDIAYGLTPNNKHHLTKFKIKWSLAGAFTLLIGGYIFGLLYSLGMFLTWKAVGDTDILVTQARHYFGVFFLLILAVYAPFYATAFPPKADIRAGKGKAGEKVFTVLLGLLFVVYSTYLTRDLLNRYWSFTN